MPAHPISTSPALMTTGIVCGLFSIGLALNAVARPVAAMTASFDLAPAPSEVSDASAARIVRDFAHLYAVRNAALGAIIDVAGLRADAPTLATAMLGGAAIAFVDGLVNERRKPGTAKKHWWLLPIGFGLSAAYFGLFD
ncbi:hypothetical protein Q5752_001930 [Cryptotrichosporon argae]